MKTQESDVRKEQLDFIFEQVLNKRRKYDGNTLVQLIVKVGFAEALDFMLN